MKKSKLFIGAILILSIGATTYSATTSSSWSEGFDKLIEKEGKLNDFRDEGKIFFETNALLKDEFKDDFDKIFAGNQDHYSDYREHNLNWNAKNLLQKIETAKETYKNDNSKLEQLDKMKNFIVKHQEQQVDVYKTFKEFKNNISDEEVYSTSHNGDSLDMMLWETEEAHHNPSELIKHYGALLECYESEKSDAESIKNNNNKDFYDVEINKYRLQDKKEDLEDFNKSIDEFFVGTGITHKDFEEAIKDDSKKIELEAKLKNNSKLEDYHIKAKAYSDLARDYVIDEDFEFDDAYNKEKAEELMDNTNRVILENRLDINKNLNDIEKIKQGISPLADNNKKLIDKNITDIAKINTEFTTVKEDIENLKSSQNSGSTSAPTVVDNKPLIDKNVKDIKSNTDNIATNKTSIETNKTAIDKNTKDIKTNTDNIKEIKDNYVSKDKLSSEVKSAVEVAKNGGTKDEKGINIGAKIEETATIKSKSNVVVAVDSEDGKETKVIGSNNSVFGIGHKVTGNGNTVLGDPTHVDGDGNTILGNNNNVKGENNIVLGNDIKIENVNNAVVLGNKSEGESNTVSVGSKDNQRRIINVADAKRDTDAVNLRQLNKVEDKLAGGLASVTAMTSLDTTPVKVGKTKIAAAVGGYNSHQAVAVGVGKNMSEGLNINFKLGANIGKASNVTYSTGISYEF